ncbi:MAG: PAS domain S-box protein, partial [Bacteroidota bacterium]
MTEKKSENVRPPIRILHLEDVRSDADLVKRAVKMSGLQFEWRWVSSKKDFELALTEFSPDIVISDHTLPNFTSIQALKIVKAAGINIPFILVTSTVSEEFATSMIKEGVADYLLKDRLQRLPNAVLAALEKSRSEKEKEAHLTEIIRSENRFRSLIENSQSMIMLYDETGNIIYTSPAVKRIFGYGQNDT